MSLNDTYRNNVARKGRELSDLQGKKAKEAKSISDLEKKINEDRRRIAKTKSESTIKTKQRNIERNNDKLSSVYSSLSKIEDRIGKKSKELENEKRKLADQERKEKKRDLQADKKHQKELQKNMKDIEGSLSEHEVIHQQIQGDISDLKNVPEKINILFITSSPEDQTRLNPDEEVREIEDKIRKSEYRDSISFVTRWAARPLDTLQAINEIKPTIIHFSGHGSEDSELAFQDDYGNTKLVSKEGIVQTIATATEDVKMIFFSSCFTHQQAKEIVKHVDASIGMINEIGDDSARIFAAYFYSSIGFGHSIAKSFKQAKAALMLEGIPEENIPELYTKDGLNSEEIILVKP
jgi:CHAT domain-containing protein